MASFSYMPSQKPEFPPLLPFGFHEMGLARIKEMCVDPFPLSKTRRLIFDGFADVVGRMQKEQIVTALLVDGSFLTEAINPRDADLVACMDSSFYDSCSPSQSKLLRELEHDRTKKNHRCHFYPSIVWPDGHKLHQQGEVERIQFLNNFAYSRKPKKTPKGMGVVCLGVSFHNMVDAASLK
jgi:hypothetical protein